MTWRFGLAAGTILLLTVTAGVFAQDEPAPQTQVPAAQPQAPAATTQPKTQSPAQPSQPQVVMPDAEKIVLLLRTTLVTLNDALQTGNFTVLRDVAAPGFRDANSAAQLSRIFANLNQQGVDLSAVTVITPQLAEVPTLDQQKGMLHLKGYFPGHPVQINFEMLYQAVGGHWRVFGLSVQPAASTLPPQSASTEKKK